MRQGLLALSLLVAGMCWVGAVGCKPQSTSQKIEDKVEDAQHEVQQGAERAKENVDRATSK